MVSVGVDHHFHIEQVGRSALPLAQAFRTFAVFYFMRVSDSRRAGNPFQMNFKLADVFA